MKNQSYQFRHSFAILPMSKNQHYNVRKWNVEMFARVRLFLQSSQIVMNNLLWFDILTAAAKSIDLESSLQMQHCRVFFHFVLVAK